METTNTLLLIRLHRHSALYIGGSLQWKFEEGTREIAELKSKLYNPLNSVNDTYGHFSTLEDFLQAETQHSVAADSS
jgi:hypothetical protein